MAFNKQLEQDKTYFIHTDHRATPMAMTDDKQQTVWQANISAWGRVKTSDSSQAKNQATLNIRLPGQYFDAETGLHDNWHRTYNPKTGRYLQPDPLGYHDGPDPYRYAGGDPVNNSDSMGLYQEDVHYYMTYFLAKTAGLSDTEALTMALASQYVDDNPFTWPLDPNAIAYSYLTHPVAAAQRLAAYHFTQAGNDDPARIEKWYVPTPEERAAAIKAGYPPLPPYISEPDDIYAARRIKNPKNSQLTRLLNAANHNLQTASNPKGASPCTRVQLFGEFLHAFEDTFGHRGKDNAPISVNAGLGHATYGDQPDYTYNDTVYLTLPSAIGTWDTREARTLQMEKEVFAKIQNQFGKEGEDKSGFPISFSDIESTMSAFNAVHQNEGTGTGKKLGILKQKLAQFGLGSIDPYAVTKACINRQNNLKPIIDSGTGSEYLGVILGTPSQCPAKRGQLTR